MQVPSLASLSRLRIQLHCRLKTQLRSGVALAVAQAGSCHSDSTPSLGTSICQGVALKRKKKKRNGKLRERLAFVFISLLLSILKYNNFPDNYISAKINSKY